MHEQRRSTWVQLFFGSSRNKWEDKTLEYVIHRIKNGGRLEEVVGEPYVRRNCSQSEIDEIVNDPRLVRAARESMKQTFNSGELNPGRADRAAADRPSRRA